MKAQTALITGASRGLGLALARELARQGWSLLIDARGVEALTAARSELSGATRVIALAGDVTDAAHRDGLAAAARELGGLDAVINNASTLGVSPLPSLLDYPIEALEAVFRANVIAPLALLQAVQDQLKPGARILNITSDAGVEAYPGWGGYGASKAALEQLSASWPPSAPTGASTGWTRATCARRCTRRPSPARTSATAPLPEESVPGLLELLDGRAAQRALPGAHAAIARHTGWSQRRRQRDAGGADGRGLRPGAGLLPRRTGPGHRHRLDSRRDGRSVVLSAGRATIELLDEADAAYTDAVEAGARIAGPVRLALEVESVEQASANLQARGAETPSGPVHTSWGQLTQRLRAPDGMQLSLYQPDPERGRRMTPSSHEADARCRARFHLATQPGGVRAAGDARSGARRGPPDGVASRRMR